MGGGLGGQGWGVVVAGEKRLIFLFRVQKIGAGGSRNLVRWTELELNNCSRGPKTF